MQTEGVGGKGWKGEYVSNIKLHVAELRDL